MSYAELCYTLLGKSAEVNTQDIYGRTPLFSCVHNIVAKGFKDLFSKLISIGAYVNGESFKRIPLFEASKLGQERVCQVLIQNGCDVNLKSSNGQTSLHTAV